MRAGIALGSNLGDRLAHLGEARRRLFSLHEGPGPFVCSRVFRTAPVDCPEESPEFFNAAVELSTCVPPLDLLRELQAIEVAMGRPRDHAFHGPRTIDLDLLYADALRISHRDLTLPHPGISSRLFVLKPLEEICPERTLPGMSAPIRALCALAESRDPDRPEPVGPLPIL